MDGEELTEQETALYDRQIRVWGVDAQRRLSKSHIFVSGLKGTVVEFCKNIVLAGVGSLTLNDDRPVAEDLLSANFLVHPESVSSNSSLAELCCDSLKHFNPMVRVSVQKGDLSSYGPEFFEGYDAVVISRCTPATKKSVNEKCRKLSKRIAFYAVDCRDSCGEIFVDLHDYIYSKKKKDGEMVECKLQYPSFEQAIAIPWASLPRKFTKLFFAMRVLEKFEELEGRNPGETSAADLPDILKLKKELCDSQALAESQIPDVLLEKLVAGREEFPPVCAIIGGILGQEVIKAISGKGDPIKNFFFFDANDGKGITEDVS